MEFQIVRAVARLEPKFGDIDADGRRAWGVEGKTVKGGWGEKDKKEAQAQLDESV